jgi:MFS family permease
VPARRLLRGLVGGGIDRELLPLIAVTVPSRLGFGAFWVFVGVWAIRGLGASPSQLGAVLLVEAVAAGAAGYLGGHLSDRVGRRPVIVWSWAAQAATLAALAVLGPGVWAGLALIVVAGSASGPGWAASDALIADLVPAERREGAYASMRVVSNLALVCGPAVAGLLIGTAGWTGFLVVDAALGALAAAAAALLLPAGTRRREERERTSVTAALRDRPFVVFLGSSVLAWIVYVGYESALPIVATTEYGVSPTTWGLLLAVNPLLVTLCQLRLTRAVAGASAALKLAVALPTMGLSFLAFEASTGVATILIVVVVFVVGEMLWAPTATAVAAAMAPERLRGAYMGAFGGTTAAGFAIGPFVALQLLGGSGPDAMWLFFAAVSVAAAAGSVAALGARRQPAVRRGAPAGSPIRRVRGARRSRAASP